MLIFIFKYFTINRATVLGTGNSALLGNDLTDPEGDGIDGTDSEAGNYQSVFKLHINLCFLLKNRKMIPNMGQAKLKKLSKMVF